MAAESATATSRSGSSIDATAATPATPTSTVAADARITILGERCGAASMRSRRLSTSMASSSASR